MRQGRRPSRDLRGRALARRVLPHLRRALDNPAYRTDEVKEGRTQEDTLHRAEMPGTLTVSDGCRRARTFVGSRVRGQDPAALKRRKDKAKENNQSTTHFGLYRWKQRLLQKHERFASNGATRMNLSYACARVGHFWSSPCDARNLDHTPCQKKAFALRHFERDSTSRVASQGLQRPCMCTQNGKPSSMCLPSEPVGFVVIVRTPGANEDRL